ncbi:MAG: response regulator [Geobacteraceae bacterium]|nr:response regulator [Geobacteraceae bacterium]
MALCLMIVDDSASMRQMVSFTLKDAGYDVIAASNGKDALTKLDEKKVSMVITDLNMPEMDGIELIRQLRKLPGLKFTPIVMLTTESQDEKKIAGKRAGASGWIVKPFKPAQLVETVRRLIK